MKTIPLLPCRNAPEVVEQIQPAIDLLVGMDTLHPNILRNAGVNPEHYHRGMVFRSAIETIRGQQAGGQTAPREAYVSSVLEAMYAQNRLKTYEHTARGVRWDFSVELESNPLRTVAVEVKGGEGNSLNISNRPPGVAEFIIWCHIDGSIKNSPTKGTRAIIGRIVADIIKAPKQIDCLVIRDVLCGTAARPCPKYARHEYPPLGPAPDIFLFPSAVPIFGKNEHPSPHSPASCLFPFRLLETYGVEEKDFDKHVHYVDIRLFYENNETRREMIIRQSGVEQCRNTSTVRMR